MAAFHPVSTRMLRLMRKLAVSRPASGVTEDVPKNVMVVDKMSTFLSPMTRDWRSLIGPEYEDRI